MKASKHPGSKALIRSDICKDATAMFNGGGQRAQHHACRRHPRRHGGRDLEAAQAEKDRLASMVMSLTLAWELGREDVTTVGGLKRRESIKNSGRGMRLEFMCSHRSRWYRERTTNSEGC